MEFRKNREIKPVNQFRRKLSTIFTLKWFFYRRSKMPSTPKKLQFQDNVRGPDKVLVTLNVNGRSYTLEIEPRRTLLDTLRYDLNMTGSKKVCDMGECGACTVLIDGKAV